MIALEVTTGRFVSTAGQIVPGDFAVFWTAARLALEGAPETVFDILAFRAAVNQAANLGETWLFWLYPPAFHVIVLPLGFLPLRLAYLGFVACSLFAFALAMRRVVRPFDRGMLLVLASPPVLLVAMYGQNSMLFAAALVGALEAVRRDRSKTAGLCLAILTLKPQFGLLVPFALVADRRWGTVAWTVAFTAILHAGASLWFGWDYLSAAAASGILELGPCGATDRCIASLVTPIATLRSLGLDYEPALVAQLVVSAFTAVATAIVWYRCSDFDLKASALLLGTLLATPYAWPYEMILPFAGVIYGLRSGLGRRTLEAVAFFWIWATPMLSLNNGPLPVQLQTLAILAAFSAVVFAGMRGKGSDPQAAAMPSSTD